MASEALDLPGIGPKLLRRLERKLGGPEGVEQALGRGDVAALSSVHGISQDRAVRIVQAHRGEALEWLLTRDAEAVAEEALTPFLARAVSSLGRARLSTLAPTRDPDVFEQRLERARGWLERLETVDLEATAGHLRAIEHPSQPRPKPERDVAILAEPGSQVLEEIDEEGLDKWVDVVTQADAIPRGSLVLAPTMNEVPPGAVHLPAKHGWEAVPWKDLAWLEANRRLLESLARLAPLLQAEDHASPLIEALTDGPQFGELDLEEIAQELVAEANATVEERIEEVTLSGKAVLEVLQGGTSRDVDQLVNEAHQEACKAFRAHTGLASDPFTEAYPIELDHSALAQLERERRQDVALERFRAAQSVARGVREHREGIDAMVEAGIELDAWQAVARTAEALALSLPEPGETFEVNGALHLSLQGEGEPVDYPVPNGVALLTGANSGGKTTLLETLGQIALLAHLGLPVPAQGAKVPVLDGLAYYARPRQLGAGAFEGFLRTVEDVLLTEDRVLVLADELEAMTELEAASAIIAEVVARLDAREAPAVLVTHLAPFILEHVQARTDGIEAKGLDESNQLVVDRTPRIGQVARSTPELILQRLRNEADGEREALYAAMLDRLD